MSRVGKKRVPVPAGVSITTSEGMVKVTGPKGELSRPLLPDTSVRMEGSEAVVVLAEGADRKAGARHGTMRANLNNMVIGVTEGYTRVLEISGVGYRALAEGKGKLVLQLGYSHPIHFELPQGIEAAVEQNNTRVVLKGISKELVGQVAANVRGFRPPEPYKGKGVKYDFEVIRRKAGKTAGS